MVYSTSVLCYPSSESTMPTFHQVHVKSQCKTVATWTVGGNIESYHLLLGFPGDSDDRESACNAGDLSSSPRLGRSPGQGNGNPPQYSCLENPQGQRNLGVCSLWDHKESDMTEGLKLFSRLWTWNVLHFPFRKEVKSGRTDKTCCLVKGLEAEYDQTCMESFKNKGFQD